MVQPSVVGAATSLIGIVSIIGAFISFGIPLGIQRFLGKNLNNRDELKDYFSSSFIFMAALSIIAGLILFLISIFYLRSSEFSIANSLILFLIMVAGGTTYSIMLASLFISTLQTKYLAIATIASTFIRLGTGVILVYFGFALTGILEAFLFAAIGVLLIEFYFVKKILNGFPLRFNFLKLKSVIHAGLASWIPEFIEIAAQWLGVIGLYAFIDSTQSGIFFIAMAIMSVIFSIPRSLLDPTLPTLSGMDHERKSTISRFIKLSYAITIPIAYITIVYSDVVLSFIGAEYIPGASALIILTIGALFYPFITGFTNLVYAYGFYKYVLLLGLSLNVLRIMLYIPLSIQYGITGAAFSYTLGFIPAIMVILFISRKINYNLNIRPILLLITLPIPLLFLSLILPWHLGSVSIVFGSIILYTRLQIIKKNEFISISESVIPKDILKIFSVYYKLILRLLYGNHPEDN